MTRTLLLTILLLSFGHLHSQQSANEYLDFAIKYTESNQPDEAIRVCNKLLIILPSNPDVFFLRGVNKYLKKDYKGAIADFDSTLKINPGKTDAYLFRAKSKKEIKDYWGALRDYNRAKDENFSSTVTSLAGDMVRSVFRKSGSDN